MTRAADHATLADAIAAAKAGDRVLEFEPGAAYEVTSPLYFGSEANGHVVLVRGNGATLQAKGCSVAMDWTGANRFRVEDLTIVGNTADPPDIGVMLARKAGNASAGRGMFTNVYCEGRYRYAALFSHQTETNLFQGCRFVNADSGPDPTYAGYFTNANPDGVTSPNATISTVATTHAFNSFLKTGFYHNGVAPHSDSAALHLGSCTSFDFGGCIFHDASNALCLVRLHRDNPVRAVARVTFKDCIFHPNYYAAIGVTPGTRVDGLAVEDCALDSTPGSADILLGAGATMNGCRIDGLSQGPIE